MIELLNPALLAGAAAAAAPLIIHVARRRQERRLDWGAMRYLEEVLRASRARLRLERWILLALRVLALLLIAMIFARPALEPAGGTAVRQGRVAAVLLIDDSASSARGVGAATRLERAKDLARAYIDTLAPGDEVSVLPLSGITGPPEDPLYDLAAARERLAALRPTALASDMPALLAAGLDRLARHLNPTAELVLASDGLADGWRADDRGRWQELRARLGAAGGPGLADGTRGRPRIVLLAPRAAPAEDAWSVESVTVDRSLVPAGVPVDLRVRVRHRGDRAPAPVALRIAVDGRIIHEAPVEPAGGGAEVAVRHVFADPGPALVEAALAGTGDDLPADDVRHLALRVERALPVVVADAAGQGAGPGLVVAAALDPAGDGGGLFAVRRIPVAALDDAALAGARCVVLAAPTADGAALAAVERFCAGGGGLLVILGPGSEALASAWWREGDGLLPARIAGPASGQARPGRPQIGHPAMAPFASAADTLRAVAVQRWWRLEGASAAAGGPAAEVLLALDSGDPLVVARQRGLGRAAALATGLDPDWSGFAAAPAVVPLLRGLIADLGSVVLPPRNLRAGDRLVHVPPGRAPGADAAASGPAGDLALAAATWEGRPALQSEPLPTAGGYRVRDGDASAAYAVTLAAGESALAPLDDAVREACLGGLPVISAEDEAAVRSTFSGDASGRELWRWLLLAALLTLAAEGLWSRRTVVGERRLEDRP
jgi:hypothetical protein